MQQPAVTVPPVQPKPSVAPSPAPQPARTAEQPSVQPQQQPVVNRQEAPRPPQPAEKQPATPSGTGGLSGSISISIRPKPEEAPRVRPTQAESLPLTQERLQEGWRQLLADWEQSHPEWAATLQGHEVRRQEDNLFAIVSSNSLFERELKLFKVPLLEFLRKRLSCPELMCNIEVHVEVSQESKAYHPIEKYEAMLQTNPELAKLRLIFGELDY